jgi:hypothetical protein
VTGRLVAAMGFPLTRSIVAALGPDATADLVQARRGAQRSLSLCLRSLRFSSLCPLARTARVP